MSTQQIPEPAAKPVSLFATDSAAQSIGDSLVRYVMPNSTWYLPVKAIVDFVAALLLFALFLPIILVAAVLVRLTSRGPAFYSQARVGKGERQFKLFKLRTMRWNAEAETGAVWSRGDDPRITWFGRFLRDTNIDEFPQLLNVLLGNMSLVGPRPERPELIPDLERQIPEYRQRHSVRPGITGIAQLRLPADSDIKSVRRKLAFDLYYVRFFGPWLDLRVMVFTGLRCLTSVTGLRHFRKAFRALWRKIDVPHWHAVRSHMPEMATESQIRVIDSAADKNDVVQPNFALVPENTAVAPDENRIIRNAFTVDVEDYFQVAAFSNSIDSQQWDNYETRVVANTQRLLKILDTYNVRGTFFVLGWVADRFPELVREISDSGHEIGCHGFWHRSVDTMTPDEFREDLLLACKAIEEITRKQVRAFRAPNFSITKKSVWALDVLIEEGFQYDSSIFPVHHDRYGIPKSERFPHLVEGKRGSLWEFPLSVSRKWRWNVPIAGGGYFRLFPANLSIRWLKRINVREQQPFVFYIHPWELDPDQPRLRGSVRSRFRHYQNLATTERKLHRLLQNFQFGSLGEVLENYGTDPQPPAGKALQLDSLVQVKSS